MEKFEKKISLREYKKVPKDVLEAKPNKIKYSIWYILMNELCNTFHKFFVCFHRK